MILGILRPTQTPSPFLVGPLKTFARASFHRSNPRSEEYMRRLAGENGILSIVKTTPNSQALEACDRIYLLWPDAIGLGGFFQEVGLLFGSSARNIWVLNGRRRIFKLTKKVWLEILLRRGLEKFWVGEILFSAFFLVATPFLIFKDRMAKNEQ